MKQHIATIALVISLIALMVSAMTFRAADAALAKRERRLVRSMTPRVEAIMRDLLATNAPFAKPPETIEELIGPLTTIISNIGK